MVANTWIAAGPGDWDDDANWSLGHSPIAGEDPTFDGTSVNNCNANDDTPTGVLTIAAGYSGTITQSSDMYISGFSMAGGVFTGVVTKWIYCDGNFTKNGGTITNDVLRLNLIDSNYIINAIVNLYEIKISGNCDYLSALTFQVRKITIDADANFNLILNGIMRTTCHYLFSYTNNGEISGNGTILFWSKNGANPNINFGIITSKIIIQLMSDSTSTDVFKINDEQILGYLTIDSLNAIYTCTLDLNGHNLTASSITVGTRGMLQCGEGTIITSALTSTSGTITEETATWIFERGSTIKVAAAQKLRNVIAKGASALKLLSDLGISGLFAHPAEIDRNGFTLTLDQPDKEYAGLRRPIIVPVKKLDIGEVGLLDSWLRDLGGLLR